MISYIKLNFITKNIEKLIKLIIDSNLFLLNIHSQEHNIINMGD